MKITSIIAAAVITAGITVGMAEAAFATGHPSATVKVLSPAQEAQRIKDEANAIAAKAKIDALPPDIATPLRWVSAWARCLGDNP